MKGIIFDLDGTMIDNMMVHHRAWKGILNDLGLDLTLEEVMEKVHGINEEILARLFGDRFSPEERKQISRDKEAQYRQIFKPQLKLVEGLDTFLKDVRAKGIPLGVATAAPPENLNFVMDNLHIRELFDVVLHAGDVTKGKPDPEVYLKAVEAIQAKPEECLVFEDSPTGARAANNAGIPVIVIKTTHTEADFEGIPVLQFINNFNEVTIDELEARKSPQYK